MTKKKKRAILFSAFALIAVILIGTTLAYFTDTDTKQNVFTIGKVSGTLTEDKSKDGKARDDGGRDYKDFKPGDSLSKVPVVNVDSSSLPAYVRIKISYDNTLSSDLITAVESGLDIQSGWTRGSDGYYYYNSIVQPGSSTAPLFTTVKIPLEWTNTTLAKGTFSMTLSADLIQSDHFTPQKDASGNIIGWTNSDGSAVTIENAN